MTKTFTRSDFYTLLAFNWQFTYHVCSFGHTFVYNWVPRSWERSSLSWLTNFARIRTRIVDQRYEFRIRDVWFWCAIYCQCLSAKPRNSFYCKGVIFILFQLDLRNNMINNLVSRVLILPRIKILLIQVQMIKKCRTVQVLFVWSHTSIKIPIYRRCFKIMLLYHK